MDISRLDYFADQPDVCEDCRRVERIEECDDESCRVHCALTELHAVACEVSGKFAAITHLTRDARKELCWGTADALSNAAYEYSATFADETFVRHCGVGATVEAAR